MVGSLMPGWTSEAEALKKKAYTRKGSFTKLEIDAFWRARRRTEEEKRRDERLRKMDEEEGQNVTVPERAADPALFVKNNSGASSSSSAVDEILPDHGGLDAALDPDSVLAGLPEEALINKPFGPDDPEDMTDEQKAARVKDWWTKSHWAFLNAPPEKGVAEGAKGYAYQTQHHLHEHVENDHALNRVTGLPSAIHR